MTLESFPKGFLWGVATASYQIEGAAFEDGKGLSIWDTFSHTPGRIADHSTGDIACDSYHKIDEDIKHLKELGVSVYRFSISWPRIQPNGNDKTPNQKGIDYYNKLINALLAANIQPFVTLYHWDLPQGLSYLGGWTNPASADWFENYARICFESFGDRVKHWITFNEPLVFTMQGYGDTVHAPGYNDLIFLALHAAHNVIRSHARAYRLYDKEFRPKQKGICGITLSFDWSEPKDPKSEEDVAASERVLHCVSGIFSDPVFGNAGDYSDALKTQLAHVCTSLGFPHSSLPSFTPSELELNKGSADFFGLNNYTTRLCSPLKEPTTNMIEIVTNAKVEIDSSWKRAASEWLYVVPWGLRKLLNWIRTTYNNPVVYITENGFSDVGQLEDTDRIDYYKQYIAEAQKAVTIDGCNLKGYMAWSLMDNFEWARGYSEKFGLYQVDFNDPERKRVAKASAKYYAEVIKNNGVTE